MAKDNLRTCAVCRSAYKYCPNCAEFKNKPAYMFTFCSDNCHDIYAVINDYVSEKISAKAARCKLDTLDLSNVANFADDFQNVIGQILLLTNTKIENVENVKNVEETDEGTVENEISEVE